MRNKNGGGISILNLKDRFSNQPKISKRLLELKSCSTVEMLAKLLY